MGLFDFFKSSEKKQKQEPMLKMHKEMFPGGFTQQEAEVQEVRQLVDFKYSRQAVEYAYVLAVVSFHTSENPKTQEIVEAILRNPKVTVTKDDAVKICLYAANKHYFEPSVSLGTTLKQKSDADKLFMIAFGGIVEIKTAYKDLSDFGKFEVLLFNSLIALQEYQSRYPEKYEEITEDFFKNIFRQASVYKLPMNTDQLVSFVNARFETYLTELVRFFDENEPGYLLLNVYTLFYKDPLALEYKTNFDIFEYAIFLPALMKMRNYIIEKTVTVF